MPSPIASRTQVAIIGGGPSGLLLSQLLHTIGVDSVVLERRSRDHVLSRIRAGVLEQGLVRLLEQAGCADRLHSEGFQHEGTRIADGDEMFRIDFARLAGASVTVYGQTELTRDLYAARDRADGDIRHGVEGVTICDIESSAPSVEFSQAGAPRRLACDFIAGCDGFHGVSRRAIPAAVLREHERVYPFGWLGVLSETPPVDAELVYARSDRGFALCSMRNAELSRYYIQCDADDRSERWTDAAFWDELKRRLPAAAAEELVTGPSIEKSVAPLRSYVAEPMRWGRLFLCGDAAHIAPPTGAKGLNTAASDAHYLFNALRRHYLEGCSRGLDAYSETALRRVWKTQRFSWWFSAATHRFPDDTAFDARVRQAEIAALRDSEAAQTAMAENYVGLPY